MPVGFLVVFEGALCPVFAYTLSELLQIRLEGLQEQFTLAAHAEPRVFNFFSGYIAVPIADALVLLADVGFDVLQFLVDALRFDALARSLVRLGVPEGRSDGQFATELGNGSVDGNAAHHRDFAVFLGLPFQVEKDFESASGHNSNFW